MATASSFSWGRRADPGARSRGARSRGARGRFGRALTGLAASAAVAVAVAGCGTAMSADHGPRPPATTVIRDSQNGKTVHLAVGDHLKLIMTSTYWNVHGSSSAAVLAQDGRSHLLPRPKTCPAIPGLGCVPFETTFTALANGTAVITASRRTCGEALACQPPQEHFKLTVVVG